MRLSTVPAPTQARGQVVIPVGYSAHDAPVTGIARRPLDGVGPPMTKKQKIWLIAGAAGLVFAVFCCAASVAGLLWLTRDDPEDVVDDYLEAVQEDNAGEAREFVCDSWRNSALPNVTNALTNWTDIVDWDIVGSETHDESATVTARVTYRVLNVTDSGTMQFTLVHEEGDWRVCGIRSTR